MGEKTDRLLPLILSYSSLSYAQSPSPVEVVKTCMDDAAKHTSVEWVWVIETWGDMKAIKYKTLESSVIDSRSSGGGLPGKNQDDSGRGG